MANSTQLLDQFLGLDKEGLARAAASAGFGGLILGTKGGRRAAGTSAKMAGVAVIGGLAYKAFKDWQAKKQAEGAPEPHITTSRRDHGSKVPVFLPEDDGAQEALSRTLVRAMLAAAKADGHIDARERKRINGELARMELDKDDAAFVMAELEAPHDLDDVVASAKTPEQAMEIYAATLVAIGQESDAARGYLAMLAERLELDPDLIAQLHVEVGHSFEDRPVQI